MRVTFLRRAHPRSRGENSAWEGQHTPSSGSSPLTRGKHDARLASEILEGLIPAHAGKTVVIMIVGPISWAHPRSRGENKDGAGKDLIRWGSSPLTRGKRTRAARPPTATGLIPAHAGKTC